MYMCDHLLNLIRYALFYDMQQNWLRIFTSSEKISGGATECKSFLIIISAFKQKKNEFKLQIYYHHEVYM